MAELTIHLEEPIHYKIQQFKADNEKMAQVNEFLDDLLEKAKAEAETRAKQKQKGKLVSYRFLTLLVVDFLLILTLTFLG